MMDLIFATIYQLKRKIYNKYNEILQHEDLAAHSVLTPSYSSEPPAPSQLQSSLPTLVPAYYKPTISYLFVPLPTNNIVFVNKKQTSSCS